MSWLAVLLSVASVQLLINVNNSVVAESANRKLSRNGLRGH